MPRDCAHLYLLRHGETVRSNCLYGHLDMGLSPRGQSQAQAQAQALAGVDLAAVASSDLRRACIGAEKIVDTQASETSWERSPHLREMCMGEGEGMGYAEARAAFPMLAGRGYGDLLDVRLPGGGESARDVYLRVIPWLRQFLSGFAGRGHVDVAIVAHNAVNRLILAHCATGTPDCYGRFEQTNGCINRIDFGLHDPERVLEAATIVYTNMPGHLARLEPRG